MTKKIHGKFFGAIKENACIIKVADTKEEVNDWFRTKHPLSRKLVWFEGSVDTDENILTTRLSDENEDAKLTDAQKHVMSTEISCYVQFFYCKIKGDVMPGTMKGTIVEFLKKIATKEN